MPKIVINVVDGHSNSGGFDIGVGVVSGDGDGVGFGDGDGVVLV